MARMTFWKKFDDRTVDFLSGRKVSPPMELRKVCDCCGLRIVKGFCTNFGTVGEDCKAIIAEAGSKKTFAEYAEQQRSIGWSVKPRIAQFLQRTVFAS